MELPIVPDVDDETEVTELVLVGAVVELNNEEVCDNTVFEEDVEEVAVALVPETGCKSAMAVLLNSIE